MQLAVFKQWCDDVAGVEEGVVAGANEQIAYLNADVGKAAADAERLVNEIAGHKAIIAVWTGDVKASTKVRATKKADCDALYKDCSESVDVLERAFAVSKEQCHDRKQAPELVQFAALRGLSLIPSNAKRAIDTFRAQDPEEGMAMFQSQGVIDMLEKLLDKFVNVRAALEKTEVEAVPAFELLAHELKGLIDDATNDRVD